MLKRAGLAVVLIGAAAMGVVAIKARSLQLQEKVRWHDHVARELRLKAQIAGVLAEADHRTDYVMAYNYTCNVLIEADVAKMPEPQAAERLQQIVRSCATFRSDSQTPKNDRQLEMARRSSQFYVQAAKHADAAATYQRAIWQPWTVTQDVGVAKEEESK